MAETDTNTIDAVETPRGVAVLSANPDDGPLRVRGVALSENDVTYGASGTEKFWPREVIEPSAAGLVGTKIVDDRQHDIPEDGDINDIPKQPSIDAIVGEITDAKYESGIGVVYEGEIDDPDVASLVENGRVEVSPFVFHEMGEADEDGVAPVKDIAHWRDLAVVSEGAGMDASIDPVEVETTDDPVSAADTQPQSTAAAMSAAALTAVLDTSFDDSVTNNDPAPSEETEVDAETTEETEPEAATESESESDAVAEGVANALEEATARADAGAEAEDDAEAPQSNEPAATATESGSSGVDAADDADSNPTDTMDLTEDEEKFVNKMRALDNPTVVESDVEALADEAEDLEIDQVEEPEVIDGAEFDDPKVVEADEYDDLSERVELIEDFMAKRLAERTGMKEETAGALSLGAMFKEFEDEDGEFDAEALVQDPVSGDSGGDTSSPDEEDAEALKQNEEQQEEIELELEALKQKRSVLGNTSIAPRLDEQIEALEAKTEEI